MMGLLSRSVLYDSSLDGGYQMVKVASNKIKQIELVPESLITNLVNHIEDGKGYKYSEKAKKIFVDGTLAIEYHLKICNGLLNSIAQTGRRTASEKMLLGILKFSAAAGLLGGVGLGLIINSSTPTFFMSLPWLMVIASPILYIASEIYDRILNGVHKITPKKYPTEKEMQKYKEHEFTYISSSFLEKICHGLELDPDDYKVDLRRAKGGGSTYVGLGSGGMIAAGITLSAISGFATWTKNGFINQRIEEVENLLFFNNVADYFNKL
jgi:hypothetical protein